MADINKRLLTSSDGIPAPQHKVKGESDFEFTEGSGGAQHTKIVDSSGQPISIDDELKSIKRTQAEILDRLDNGIDTRVTGSIVQQDYLQGATIPQGSSVDVPIETFKSKRISVGILFIDISRFSFRTISRGANEIRYLDSITHDSEEGRRNISQLELRTKITTVRVQNEDDKDIEIDYLTITEFVGEA